MGSCDSEHSCINCPCVLVFSMMWHRCRAQAAISCLLSINPPRCGRYSCTPCVFFDRLSLHKIGFVTQYGPQNSTSALRNVDMPECSICNIFCTHTLAHMSL